eukprot:6698254-Lingulodinium_polyedra.AAC.1
MWMDNNATRGIWHYLGSPRRQGRRNLRIYPRPKGRLQTVADESQGAEDPPCVPIPSPQFR